MTDPDAYKNLICPDLAKAMIVREGTFYDPELAEPNPLVMCLGPKCAMYNANDRKCGLRHR